MLHLTQKLSRSVYGFKLALTTIALLAGVSALRLSFNLGSQYQLYMCVYPSLSQDAPFLTQIDRALSFAGEKFFLVTLALFFSVVGLWTRRVSGFLLSLIALLSLAAVYFMWYLATLSNMRMFGARDFSEMPDQQQYLVPLLGAASWDTVVLGVALAVIVWQAVMLKRILKPSQND